ncbi:hypothetical protein ACFXTO_006650 [Malus domestica]
MWLFLRVKVGVLTPRTAPRLQLAVEVRVQKNQGSGGLLAVRRLETNPPTPPTANLPEGSRIRLYFPSSSHATHFQELL